MHEINKLNMFELVTFIILFDAETHIFGQCEPSASVMVWSFFSLLPCCLVVHIPFASSSSPPL